uniref:Uncharacterized protein n=1 Tax=Rhizophora mucronata TaxID=61149 RepID=A0A2P2PCD9_RHIMU
MQAGKGPYPRIEIVNLIHNLPSQAIYIFSFANKKVTKLKCSKQYCTERLALLNITAGEKYSCFSEVSYNLPRRKNKLFHNKQACIVKGNLKWQ